MLVILTLTAFAASPACADTASERIDFGLQCLPLGPFEVAPLELRELELAAVVLVAKPRSAPRHVVARQLEQLAVPGEVAHTTRELGPHYRPAHPNLRLVGHGQLAERRDGMVESLVQQQ